MRTHSHKSRSSEQQTHIRLGYLMAYLLNRALKIWPGWLFLLLGLAVADASYGQDTGRMAESSSLCSAIPEEWMVRDGIISKKLTDYTYSGPGADLSKPVGGWDKYYAKRIITEKQSESSTYKKASNLTQLRDKLHSATAGDTIFVVGTADILITEKLVIPPGVTLASNRGQAISNVRGNHISNGFALGALLHIDDLANGLPSLLIVEGDNVRITGLRLRGPQREVHPWGEGNDRVGIINSSLGSSGHENLEVDNCELFQWPQSAIYVGHGGSACVRNNYIHHNQRWKAGYGVGLQGEAKVSIEENLFAFNRHCVAGTGYPTQEYTARHNVVLASNNPPFDMHGLIEGCPYGLNDKTWDCNKTQEVFGYDVTGTSRVGTGSGEGHWHFGRSNQLSPKATQPPDNQIGGKKIHITKNTVASVTNNYKPMDLAQRKSLNAGRFGPIAAVYLRGVPWVEAVVENNSFAHPSRWNGAYKQVPVNTTKKYNLPYNFNKSGNDNTNGVGNAWDHDNKYRRFFERFGDVFQEEEETTIPDDGHFSFSSDKWRYKWSADSGSRYRLKSSVLQTWRVQNENRKATTKHDLNDPIGEMRSKRFRINKDYVSFRIAGYMNKEKVGGITSCPEPDPKYANQVSMLRAHDDAVIFKKDVPCADSFVLYDHDLRSHNDDDTWAYFVLSDGDWHNDGWIEVDDIYFFDGPPTKPTNLRAEVNYGEEDSSDNFTVKLSWDDPDNPSIRRWEYQWRESGGTWSSWQQIDWQDIDYSEENKIAIHVSAPVNPPMATTYEYKVRGYNRGGDGAASDSVSVKIFAFPGPPENLMAKEADEAVRLTWETPTSDGGTPITGYAYRYRADDGTTWQPSETGGELDETTFYIDHTIDNLTNGTEYTFEVWARNKVGNGAAMSVKATPQAAGPISVSFGSESYQAFEGGAAALVMVQLSPPPSRSVSIPVVVSADEGTEAGDYTVAGLNEGTVWLSFAAEVSEQSFMITANEDADSDHETVSLSFKTSGEASATQPVEVTLHDNDSMVSLSSLSPQEGAQLTAEWTGPSGITNPRWQWKRQLGPMSWTNVAGVSSQPQPWVSIYIPQAGDVGYPLRATVRYTDGGGSNQRAESATTAPVRAAPPSRVNRPPSAPVGPGVVSVAENTTAIATYISADPDGDALGWTVSPSDTFAISGGALSFQNAPDYESGNTVYTATLKTYDGALWSPSKTVAVRVTDVDDVAPVLDPVGPLTCYVGEYCSFTFPVAKKGTEPITYKVSPPSWAKASGRSFSGTAPSSPGTASASLNASNAYGTDSESLTINIEKRSVIKVAPVLDPVGPLTCYVGEYCSFTFPVATRGTKPITYRVSPPSWATASGRSFSGTAPSSPGTASASLNASNAYGMDSESLTINIEKRPVAGVAPVLDPVGPLTCYVGEYCSFTFPVAKKGTAPITYKVSPPSWATASSRSFSGTAPSSPGTFSASLNASNAYGMDSESLTIKVKKRGYRPVLASVSSITCYVGEYCSFTFPAATRGTKPITYKVSPPSWATASGRSFSGTAPSSPGTASASLNASNAYGMDSESLTINIKRRPVAGVAPVLPSVSSITCYVGEYCSFTFPAATSGTAPITYKVSPPSWATASGRSFSGTAPSSPGTFSASLNASNAYGTDSESLTIKVKKRVYPPVLASVSSITCYVGEYCSFTFPAATSGTKPITYKVSPPSWATASGRGFAGPAPSSPGTFSASISASNAYGTDSESLTINVKKRLAIAPGAPSAPSAASGFVIGPMAGRIGMPARRPKSAS